MKAMKTKIAALISTGALAALLGGVLLALPTPARADGFAITLGNVHIGYWSHGSRCYPRWHRDGCERPEYYHPEYYHPEYYHPYYHRVYYYHPEYYRVIYRERDWDDRGWHRGWRHCR